jgi:hypothetical protein
MLRYMVFSRRKSYSKISGYVSNANTRDSFLSHIAFKFQRVKVSEDGKKRYEPYFTIQQLRKALSRGYIAVELVGIAI